MEKAKSEKSPLNKNLPDMDVFSILMQTPVAICIFRGKEYTLEFANNFYLQILDKSSDIVGKPLFESFPELKNQGFDKLIDGVMETGMPYIINEHAALISRDGKESLCFFHCVYQPLREQSGAITGVIVVFTEVTELVLAKNRNLENQQKISEELTFSKNELAFQKEEKGKRAAELGIANKELAFQKEEKGKRAAELGIANKELAFQDDEKEKRAVELIIANKELVFQNDEKEKRAAELIIANKELIFQNDEKEKRANELIVVNKKLEFQNKEKEKRADELFIANQELIFQTGEKEKRAAELVIADIELDFQNKEKEKRELANMKLEAFSNSLKLASQYSLSLIEASRDPLFTISPQGKITDMNEATVRVTGVPRNELIGADFFNYFTQPNKAKEGYQEVFDKGFVADYPLTLMDGKLTDVLFNGSVYKDDRGNVLGAVVVARDITDQKRIEKELIEAKVAAELATGIAEEAKRKAEDATRIAEDAVKSKQQFLSNMSHEIRTPMNAIIGFTKVVLKTELSAKQKEYLTAIKMSGDALIVLINDILDLAKVDAGKMTFEKTPFKMASSISAMLHLFEAKIQEKNLELIKEYDINIPEVLIGDPVRLHQIILNLVSNAVKFTAKGRITVSVKKINEDEEKVSIEFAVSDTGIGISENKMIKVFDNFQQASSNTARLFGGTGLGLAIVKQLVEQQGGVVAVKSTLEVGSTFSFTLDFQKTVAKAEMETEIMELNTAIKNIKVLVVEDMALNQLLMRTILDDFGFERDIAANGKIAIEKLTQRDAHGALTIYDIILMDLQMPEMNGFEATEYIRNTMKSKIPIIALTADVTTVDLAKCKAVGMNDYLAKPIDERLLYSKIVGLVKKPIADSVNKEKKIEPIEKARCTNLGYLNKMTKSNPILMMEMIKAYLQQTPLLIDEMKSSFQEKNWLVLQTVLHKMIPSFPIMGMNTDYSFMAKDMLKYTHAEQKGEDITEYIEQIENICLQACEELEEEINKIKVDKA
jgi:PAS domain S-box-containing protein